MSRTTIVICDERCIVMTHIISTKRVCFLMAIFVYPVCSKCCVILDNDG
jgi:hypothetical protein